MNCHKIYSDIANELIEKKAEYSKLSELKA